MINRAYCLAHELDAVIDYNCYRHQALYYYAKAVNTGNKSFVSVARSYEALAETARIEIIHYRKLYRQCLH